MAHKNTKQKIKGKLNQVKGEIKQRTGKLGGQAEGAWDKLKGKVQEETAEHDIDRDRSNSS